MYVCVEIGNDFYKYLARIVCFDCGKNFIYENTHTHTNINNDHYHRINNNNNNGRYRELSRLDISVLAVINQSLIFFVR